MKWPIFNKKEVLLFLRIIRAFFWRFLTAFAAAFMITKILMSEDNTALTVLTAIFFVPAVAVYFYKLFRSYGFFTTADKEMKEWVRKHWPPPED